MMRHSTHMVIGVDAGPLLGHGGISGYVTPLVRTLLRIDPATHYHLVLRQGWRGQSAAHALDGLAPVTRVRLPDRLLTFWWERLGWSLPVQRKLWKSLDLFLATCLVAPVLPRGQVIGIVYDLIPLKLPHLFVDHRRFQDELEQLLHRCTAVVAISQRTKQDLVEVLGVNPAQVRVIYPGRDAAFRPMAPTQTGEVTERHGIRGRYILYVGALGPHKNVSTLLQAYQEARLQGGLMAQLVVVGSQRWGQETLAFMETLRVRGDIVRTGWVPTEDLPALYAGADCFVFPSRYEGFGLPVLEAMGCGTPVIVSDRGALPEVAGEAGLYVDPENPTALAEAMCRVARDATVRAHMVEASLQQALRFCWDQSAAELQALCYEVAGRRDDYG